MPSRMSSADAMSPSSSDEKREEARERGRLRMVLGGVGNEATEWERRIEVGFPGLMSAKSGRSGRAVSSDMVEVGRKRRDVAREQSWPASVGQQRSGKQNTTRPPSRASTSTV
jgi:hypothetical protein